MIEWLNDWMIEWLNDLMIKSFTECYWQTIILDTISSISITSVLKSYKTKTRDS